MTDNPLDCIGVPAGGIGKHNFHELGGKPTNQPPFRLTLAIQNDRLRTAVTHYVADLKALLRYPPSRSRDDLAAGLLKRLEEAVEAYPAI